MTTSTSRSSTEPGQVPSLLRLSGFSYFLIGFFGRMPFAVLSVGVLTLVAAARDSYAEAGLASGVVGIGSMIFGPVVGALADRYGQRTVLLGCVAINAVSLVGVVVLSYRAPFSWVLVAAFAIGMSAPQVASMSRSRWMTMIARVPQPGPRTKLMNRVSAQRYLCASGIGLMDTAQIWA